MQTNPWFAVESDLSVLWIEISDMSFGICIEHAGYEPGILTHIVLQKFGSGMIEHVAFDIKVLLIKRQIDLGEFS